MGHSALGSRRMLFGLLTAFLLVAAPGGAEVTSDRGTPHGLPPALEGEFVALNLTYLNGDADFPMLLAKRADGGSPQFILLVVDARNGKNTWSLREDPVVFYLLFSDPKRIQQAFLDEGFASQGQPSGQFMAGGPEEVDSFVARLGESYSRCRSEANGRMTA